MEQRCKEIRELSLLGEVREGEMSIQEEKRIKYCCTKDLLMLFLSLNIEGNTCIENIRARKSLIRICHGIRGAYVDK